MAMIERICEKCGKTIQVPEELETFSCVYCGEKMTAPAKRLPIGESVEADRAFALAHLIDGVKEHPKYFVKNFKKGMYVDSFYEFKQSVEPTYAAMDRYILANPDRREALLEEFTDRFLAEWETLHNERRGEAAAFSDKMTLALFEVPAVMDMELNAGRDYCELLERKFIAKYPKNEFHVATFDVLAAGFTRKKLCFVTTAICAFEGKPDDCAELTAFRAFRDGWLTDNGDEDLIAEYYEIAPAIVHAIDYCDDRETRYADLRRDYLTPCYEALARGDMQSCRSRYVEMVRSLSERYGLQ